MELPTLRIESLATVSAEGSRAFAGEVAGLVDAAAEALGGITEASITEGLEAALRAVSAALGALDAELPAAGAEAAASPTAGDRPARLAQDAETLSLRTGHLAMQGAQELFSAEETQQLLRLFRGTLQDVRAALDEVTREEIEEISAVALGVARMAASAAQRAIRQTQARQPATNGVTIEEVTEGAAVGGGGAPPRRSSRGPAAGAPRGLPWPPLWPTLCGWVAQPTLPQLPHFSIPAWLIVVLIVALPMWLVFAFFAFWALVLLVPWLLLADMLLRRLYESRQPEVDDFIDGFLQVSRLGYLASRLAYRRVFKVARAQVRRALGGRTLSEAARGALQHPVESAATAAQLVVEVGVAGSKEALQLGRTLYGHMPPAKVCFEIVRACVGQGQPRPAA